MDDTASLQRRLEVEDGRGTLDLACAFAVLFGVLEAWKCFADS